MKHWRLSALLVFAPLAPLFAQGAEADALMGTWRIVRVQAIPPAHRETPSPALAVGASVRLHRRGIESPFPLGCSSTRMQVLDLPAEGLFQGTLSRPSVDAERLGLAPPVPTLRIDCDSGSWDLHAADADTLLFALDRRVYTLSRGSGTRAREGSPEHAVQRLLEQHFAGSMSFDEAHWTALERWLSQPLKQSIASYREAGWPLDEVPPINGDPLSDSQEYPTRFAVGPARIAGAGASLEVEFADAHVRRRLRYLLVLEDAHWRVDDVIAVDGTPLRELLAERP
jgi:hypothetical protein